ncbi:MAG: RdgB/HAM1 family non-canonical purine NTP pyrophosphatase [Sphingobacteriales bacterium]|nr:MAG: RdgB/HAM1 family non-canonical purine NTP pyrophosphatase [Sphingobacteriales bacterium]
MQLVLASNNAKKIAEIRSLLPDIRLVSLSDIGFTDEIPEPYDTFRQNAAHKAETIHRFCQLPVLADDSGLCVAALDGAPGVYSARYAGTPTDDARNSQKLLAELTGIQNREAFFICTIALTGYREETLFFEGRMAGAIAENASGSGGFGYDPVFIPEGQNQTLADLPPTYKAAHSHRAKALAALQELLG